MSSSEEFPLKSKGRIKHRSKWKLLDGGEKATDLSRTNVDGCSGKSRESNRAARCPSGTEIYESTGKARDTRAHVERTCKASNTRARAKGRRGNAEQQDAQENTHSKKHKITIPRENARSKLHAKNMRGKTARTNRRTKLHEQT